MPIEEISVILCTDAHCVAGKVRGKGQRMLEVLNDPSSAYLNITEAILLPLRIGGREVKLDEATIPKARLAACLLTAPSHEAPEKRQYAFVAKQKRPATILVHGWEIKGMISFKGTPDPVNLLQREFGEFFPVTDATVHFASSADSFTANVAIVNRARLSLLHVSESA